MQILAGAYLTYGGGKGGRAEGQTDIPQAEQSITMHEEDGEHLSGHKRK